MKKNILVLSVLLLSASALAFSRGPYLPKNEEVKVPYGTVVYQQGADESGEYRDLDYDYAGISFKGDAVVKLLDGRFEIIELSYLCESIDDGAYGALACDKAEYVATYGKIYQECEFAHDSFWCE